MGKWDFVALAMVGGIKTNIGLGEMNLKSK
jgi:hypothetical protein